MSKPVTPVATEHLTYNDFTAVDMIPLLLVGIIQTNPLGNHPAVWESKKYGIRMSYPRSWHIVQTTPPEKSDRVSPIPVFEVDTGEIHFDIHARIGISRDSRKMFEKNMSRWPHVSPSGQPALHEFPTNLCFGEPMEINHIRGIATVEEATWSSAATYVDDVASFEFETPAGALIEFTGSTTDILHGDDAMKHAAEFDHPTSAIPASKTMQAALPIFNAMLQSIAFTMSKGRDPH